MLAAAIGIGSNSLRMLIADIENTQLRRVLRDRAGLRVFAALDQNGNITEDMMEKAAQSVLGFVQKAASYHVEKLHLFATSAVRDAANQEAFCERIYQATGLRPEICSGEMEAMLSFLGATDGERVGVIDIGGGSTEIVVGKGRVLDNVVSLQMGAVRLYRKHLIQSEADARKVAEIAGEILQPAADSILTSAPEKWVGVGGTFTTTAALLQNISWTQKDLIHQYPVSRANLESCIRTLAPMSPEERNILPGLQPQRADIVVHGMAILLGCMQSLGIDRITVSECGNLEGYLKYLYCSDEEA